MKENWTEIKMTVENTVTKITEFIIHYPLYLDMLKMYFKPLELTYFFIPLKFRKDIAQEYMKLNLQELQLY